MANIDLVIRIPEEQYNAIKSDLYNTFSAEMKIWGLEAIRNGTPLPKRHGKLIDADKAVREENSKLVDFETFRSYCRYARIILNDAPTIIEADKTEL